MSNLSEENGKKSRKKKNEKDIEAFLDEHDSISEMSPQFKKRALTTLMAMLRDMKKKAD